MTGSAFDPGSIDAVMHSGLDTAFPAAALLVVRRQLTLCRRR